MKSCWNCIFNDGVANIYVSSKWQLESVRIHVEDSNNKLVCFFLTNQKDNKFLSLLIKLHKKVIFIKSALENNFFIKDNRLKKLMILHQIRG